MEPTQPSGSSPSRPWQPSPSPPVATGNHQAVHLVAPGNQACYLCSVSCSVFNKGFLSVCVGLCCLRSVLRQDIIYVTISNMDHKACWAFQHPPIPPPPSPPPPLTLSLTSLRKRDSTQCSTENHSPEDPLNSPQCSTGNRSPEDPLNSPQCSTENCSPEDPLNIIMVKYHDGASVCLPPSSKLWW